MIDAIGSKPCTNQLNTPINAYVGYLKTHIEGTRAAIQQVISQVCFPAAQLEPV